MDGILSVEVGEVRTTESAGEARRNFAKHLAEKNPKIPPTKLMKAVRKKFGRGIEFYGAKEIIAEAKKNTKKRPQMNMFSKGKSTVEVAPATPPPDFQRFGVVASTPGENHMFLVSELRELHDRILHANVTALSMKLVEGVPVWTITSTKEETF